MRQLTLLKEKKYAARKCARPISLRGANHIVLKSLRPTLRRHIPLVRTLIRDTQIRFGVKIRAFAIMPDHIHLVAKVSSRKQFADALRYLAGAIARTIALQVSNRIPGNYATNKLWRARAWSRPIKTRRDLQTVEIYVARNSIKAGIFIQSDSYYILDGVLQL